MSHTRLSLKCTSSVQFQKMRIRKSSLSFLTINLSLGAVFSLLSQLDLEQFSWHLMVLQVPLAALHTLIKGHKRPRDEPRRQPFQGFTFSLSPNSSLSHFLPCTPTKKIKNGTLFNGLSYKV